MEKLLSLCTCVYWASLVGTLLAASDPVDTKGGRAPALLSRMKGVHNGIAAICPPHPTPAPPCRQQPTPVTKAVP